MNKNRQEICTFLIGRDIIRIAPLTFKPKTIYDAVGQEYDGRGIELGPIGDIKRFGNNRIRARETVMYITTPYIEIRTLAKAIIRNKKKFLKMKKRGICLTYDSFYVYKLKNILKNKKDRY